MLLIYRLPRQLPGEKVIKVLRRDYFILFKRIVVIILGAFLLLLLFKLMFYIFPNLLIGEISYPVVLLAISLCVLFVWLFSFFSFIDYYLDTWIITNLRIIDIRQQGFFSRIIAEQRLDRVQDVMSETHGFFSTIFRYGNVRVQTAGEEGRFFFQEIPNPDKIRDVIIKLSEQCKHSSHNI